MTYETETSLDQTASPSAKVVKKIWSRPELQGLQWANCEVRRVAGSDCLCVVSAPCA
jgi:hypothetical protein